MDLKSPLDTIRSRRSHRKFLSKVMDESDKSKIVAFIAHLNADQYRFELVYSPKDKRHVLLATTTQSEVDSIRFGYDFEQVILYCTELGFGTCWMGLFNRRYYAKLLRNQSIHSLCIISPVAYSDDTTPKKTRKNWTEIFFEDTFQNSLHSEHIGDYATVLEMTQMAPSGMNLQPWKILYREKQFHFFLDRKRGILGAAFHSMAFDMQKVDMGIAISHFTLAANELKLVGEWIQNKEIQNEILCPYEYIQSWQLSDQA